MWVSWVCFFFAKIGGCASKNVGHSLGRTLWPTGVARLWRICVVSKWKYQIGGLQKLARMAIRDCATFWPGHVCVNCRNPALSVGVAYSIRRGEEGLLQPGSNHSPLLAQMLQVKLKPVSVACQIAYGWMPAFDQFRTGPLDRSSDSPIAENPRRASRNESV